MDTLFKYFQINDNFKTTLVNNQIWFSSPDDFNDPFDCNLKCQYLKDVEFEERINDELREEFNSVDCNEQYFRKHKMLTSIAEAHDDNLKTNTSKLNINFQESVKDMGVACFSKKNDSILMWSHYADNHKGVCLKFKTSDAKFFDNVATVKYTEKFPNLNYEFQYSDSQNFLFFTKSKEWTYEEEVRVLKKPRQLFKFKPEVLDSIYFGAKCTVKNRNEIIELVQEKREFENVKFFKVKLDSEAFKLRFEEIT
jgi:hypothetical protein